MKTIIFILIMVVAAALPGISEALELGEKAPGFEAVSTHGTVILSEFEGNNYVVLALYYADFTPV